VSDTGDSLLSTAPHDPEAVFDSYHVVMRLKVAFQGELFFRLSISSQAKKRRGDWVTGRIEIEPILVRFRLLLSIYYLETALRNLNSHKL